MKSKNKRLISLSAGGIALLAVMTTLHLVAESQSGNLDLLFPGEAHITDTGEGLDGNYYDFECKSQDEALQKARDITQLTAEEGMTLLKNKNNALPLTKTQKITVLGYYSWHNNMSGGEDPATTAGAISLGKGLEKAFDTNAAVNSLYASARGDFADPVSAFQEVEGTFAEYDTAVITIKRNSGEGNDQSTDSGVAEQHRTGLTLNNAELNLIDYASKKFKKVVLVINAANTMELGFLNDTDPNLSNGIYTDPYNKKQYDFSRVDAAIWAGCCGSQGGTALANILNGTVNPSGHLPDTYVRDLRNEPTYKNFGSYKYANSSSLNSYQQETFFVEYEEGVYIGYRYHETAAYEAARGNYEGYDYQKEVVFPMGYGLSYTDFSLEYADSPSYDAETHAYKFKVKIKNTGSVAGKGVAQIYVNAPYITGGVEKAHVVLGGFAKSKVLKAGEEQILDIDVQEDYFASYDYTGDKCYILDQGDYNFYLSENSHSWEEIEKMSAAEKAKRKFTYNLSQKVTFKEGKDGKRFTDKEQAVNKEDKELNYKFKRFGEGSTGDGFAHEFTRANFKSSFPTSPTGNDLILTGEYALKQIAKYDVWAEENNPITEEIKTDVDRTKYVLSDMRGVDYDDPKWDDYIDQFSLDSTVEMFSNGGWQETADEDNGVPLSKDADSPYGYYAHALNIKNVNKWYCGGPMVAATYNVELAKEIGYAFGEEAHANKLAGGDLITGVYAYGANTHRSAFGGRNYEYYSEDPYLAGKMAANEASGASEKGLIVFMKHFALNEQETNRQKNGYCAWTTEQAFREIYVKPWEIYIKEAKMQVKYYDTDEEGKYIMSEKTMPAATGIMTAYNRIGATYAGASESIIEILQKECGYVGSTITDAGGQPNTYMTTDFLLRRGGNLTLTNNGSNGLYDTESNTAKYFLKQATKQTVYNKANSNIMEGIAPGAHVSYDMAPWRIVLYTAWGVVSAACLADIVYLALVATNKVKVVEKAKIKKDDEDEEEF